MAGREGTLSTDDARPASQQSGGTARTRQQRGKLTWISHRVILRETAVAEIKTRPYQAQTDRQLLQEGAVGEREMKRSRVNIVMRENMLDFKHSVHN